MSELDIAWSSANTIADDISRENNLNWAAHMRGLITLGQSLEKERDQLQAKQ